MSHHDTPDNNNESRPEEISHDRSDNNQSATRKKLNKTYNELKSRVQKCISSWHRKFLVSTRSFKRRLSNLELIHWNLFLTVTLVVFTCLQWWATVKAYRMSERAWVSVKEIFLKDIEIGKAPSGHTRIFNSGHSPALQSRVASFIDFGPINVPPDSFPKERNNADDSLTTIGPDVTQIASVKMKGELTQELFDLLNEKKIRIYVYGRITYDDIFKKSHTTDFCMYWNGSFSGNNMNSCSGGNWAN